MKEFIENILANLKKSGFPAKRVSLPTEKMYEAADRRGFSFNKVLEELKAQHGIQGEIGPDKIIFSAVNTSAPKSQEELIREAQEMMAKMDPAELRKLQEMFQNMTQEEKEEIMKKGKDLGLI